jgi:1,4-alpha-glucan branching enzyme
MGGELASPWEWGHETVLDWNLHDAPGHEGVRRFVAALNHLYAAEPALHRRDCHPEGFSWIIGDDAEHSVFVYARHAPGERSAVVVVNATPGVHHQYRIGVPAAGRWVEALNSDDHEFGGSGMRATGPSGAAALPVDSHGHFQSILVTVPPLAVVVLVPER